LRGAPRCCVGMFGQQMGNSKKPREFYRLAGFQAPNQKGGTRARACDVCSPPRPQSMTVAPCGMCVDHPPATPPTRTMSAPQVVHTTTGLRVCSSPVCLSPVILVVSSLSKSKGLALQCRQPGRLMMVTCCSLLTHEDNKGKGRPEAARMPRRGAQRLPTLDRGLESLGSQYPAGP